MLITAALWIGFVFVLLVFIELMRMNVLLFRALDNEPTLPEQVGLPDNPHPLVTIVVPAKDEVSGIEASVRSIIASDYSNLEIVLVNDRSEDDTLRIMERLAQEDQRIKVISIHELPKGWTGKTHAMFRAAQEASGDIFLFTDADVFLDPKAISQVLRFFKAQKLDMFSLLPGFVKKGFNENAVHPHMALGISYFYPLTDVNNPAKEAALASGCFIMITRQGYEKLGTWERFRNEVTEDVALSKAAKANGLKLMVMRGFALVRTKPFDRLSDVCRFWKRTYYGGLEKNVAKIARLTMNYAVLSLMILLFAVSAIFLLIGRSELPAVALFIVSLLAMAAVIIPFSIFINHEQGDWIYALASPVGVFVCLFVSLSTLFTVLTNEGIRWRGSTYR
ncbi:MAG: glycosyltransferase [Desulfomonile tiedjei]|nr:glycosyltransferase [Desulfomonile tiedjei]